MKVTVPTATLLEAVGHGTAVAATKSPKPALECVALRADTTTGLTLEATDLDVGIRLHLPEATVAEEGVAVVPASRLLGVLREVEEESTTLESHEGALVLTTGRSRFRLRLESEEEFPELPRFPDDERHTLPGALLRQMIRRTVFAAAKEPGRFALHGVLFRVAGEQVELVATDGRRLARAACARQNGANGEAEVRVIVGPKGLSHLDRLLGSDPGEVSLAVRDRQVLFQLRDALIVSRLIDGSFPAYEDVIPRNPDKVFTIQAAAFATALRQVSLLTTRDAVSVQFDVEPEQLTIRSRAMDVGEALVHVPIAYQGPGERLGFNPAFLLDVLKVMDPAGEVRFQFVSPKAPTKLSDGEDFVYVVMPIALE
jgi:DNA polymerase-3 subunit beta